MVDDIRYSLPSARVCLPTSLELVYCKAKLGRLARRLLSRLCDARNQCVFDIIPEWGRPNMSRRYKAGTKEAQILYKLKQADPEDKKHIVRLERTFEHRGHLCLVFESLR